MHCAIAPKVHCFTARPISAHRATVVAPVRAQVPRLAYDSDEDISNSILSGEWSATMSLSLPRMPEHGPARPAAMLPSLHADEEGIDATNVLGGEWDARSCSLASYDDVLAYFETHKPANPSH